MNIDVTSQPLLLISNKDLRADPGETRESITTAWEDGWRRVFAAITPLGPDDLGRRVTIRGEAHTVLQAINRQLTHYAAHVGQIVLLAKHVAGPAWKTLSVPRGKSKEFEVSKRGARFEVPPGSGEPASRER